jgi:hypothetical protein
MGKQHSLMNFGGWDYKHPEEIVTKWIVLKGGNFRVDACAAML